MLRWKVCAHVLVEHALDRDAEESRRVLVAESVFAGLERRFGATVLGDVFSAGNQISNRAVGIPSRSHVEAGVDHRAVGALKARVSDEGLKLCVLE